MWSRLLRSTQRANQVLRSDGLGALMAKSLLHLTRLVYTNDSYLVFEHTLEYTDFVPKGTEVALKIISSPEDLAAMSAEGYDLSRLELPRTCRYLAKKDMLICIFISGKLAHQSWVSINSDTNIDPIAPHVNYQECTYIGACQTWPEYRGLGLYPYALSEICKMLKSKRLPKAILTVAPDNKSSIAGVTKAGFRQQGKGRFVRLLSLSYWHSDRKPEGIQEMNVQTYDIKTRFPHGIVLFHEALINPGGAERLVVEEYRHLRAKEVATRLISFHAEPRALYGMELTDVEIIPRRNLIDGILQLRRRLIELNPDLVIVASGQRDLYLATRFCKVSYLLHQHEPVYKELVVRRCSFLPLVNRRAVKEIKNSAYGYRHVPVLSTPKSPISRVVLEVLSMLDWLIIREARAVTVLSQRAAQEVSSLYGRGAMPLRGAFPRGIFSHEKKRSLKEKLGLDHGRVVLSISRLDPLKRLDIIIRAFARVNLQIKDAYLVIGGTGPEEKVLKILAEDLGLNGKIIFLGFVPDNELWDMVATCDVFVCADWADFDIAPFEALALGRRVVWSSEMETDEEFLQGGYVFAADPTVEGFADGIVSALQATGSNDLSLRDHLERYTWDEYVSQVLRFAAQCISGKD